jgi:hypothetical protein
MGTGTASPRSQQRLRVFEAYRGRGKRTNPLWLVYSVKTGRDWILSSDRHLIHWLVHLETEPAVKSFDLGAPNDQGSEFEISVTLTDGGQEMHVVRSGTPFGSTPRTTVSETDGKLRRSFDDIDLKPVVSCAMHWFKALAFAAAVRDLSLEPVRLALVTHLHSEQAGTIHDLVAAMNEFEEPAVLGVLVRLAIEGHISLDMKEPGLSYATQWQLREGGNSNVVS